MPQIPQTVRLANRLQIVETDARIFLVDDEIAEIDGIDSVATVGSLLRMLSVGTTRAELEAAGGSHALPLLQLLDHAGLLRFETLSPPRTAWARQVQFLDDFSVGAATSQARLARSHVAIIGVGGVGCVVAEHLARAGVGRLTLIDGDVVAPDNLNRQLLFRHRDVGRAKTDAAADALREIIPGLDVKTSPVFVRSGDDLRGFAWEDDSVDLIVNAADQPADIRRIVGEFATRGGYAHITAGLGRHVGSWGPLLVPGFTPCANCFDVARLLAADETSRVVGGALAGSPPAASFGPHNTVVSAMAARDVVLSLAVSPTEASSLGVVQQMDFRTAELVSRAFGDACSCWAGSRV